MALSPPAFFSDDPCFPCNGDPNCLNDSDCLPPSSLIIPPTPLSMHTKSNFLPTLLIVAAALLAFSFLLLLTVYVVHRLRRRRRRLSIAPTDHLPSFSNRDAEHHVWNIRTVGLEESLIQEIETRVYSAKDGKNDGVADCAVCLGELRDGEMLRLLPKCGHAFHLPCIDKWLRSHLNCPLCRALVLVVANEVGSSPVVAEAENTQIELDLVVDPETASSSSQNLREGIQLQPVRRSVSMDAESLAVLLLRASPEMKFEEEMKEVITKGKGKQGSDGKKGNQRKGIGRSMSTRSGRLIFDKHRRWNSVLPL